MFGNGNMARPAPGGANHSVGTGTGIGSLPETIISAAVAEGNREAALRGMIPQSTLPPEEYPGSPATHTCQQCGRRTCFEGLCTPCLERQARSEERLDALEHGYRQDEHGDWRRR